MRDARYLRGQAVFCLKLARQMSDSNSASNIRAEAARYIAEAGAVEAAEEWKLKKGVPAAGAIRTSATTSESLCARAPCGDVTRGGGIPGVAIRQYAGRHDRHASDSQTLEYRRLEAR